MTTMLIAFENWLPKIQEIDLILILPQSNFKDMIEVAKKYPNIKKIFVLGTLIVSGKKVSLSDSVKDPQIILYDDSGKSWGKSAYIYLNFLKEDGSKSTEFITGKGPVGIEYFFAKPSWRRKCASIFLDNYADDTPIFNYWKSIETYILTRSTWAVMCQDLFPPSNKSDPKIWRSEFKTFLIQILKYIVRDEDVNEFVTEKYFHIWVRAMTHITYNILFNYEPIEYYGDSVSKFAFGAYMQEKFPKFTSRELTEYSNQYMSKKFQSVFSDDLRLTQWGIYDPIISNNLNNPNMNNEKIKTDYLESFSGALTFIGNQISHNLGTIACCNLYGILGESLPFPSYMLYGTVVTQVTQINESLRSFINNQKIVDIDDSGTQEVTNGTLVYSEIVIKIRIPNDFYDFLKKYFEPSVVDQFKTNVIGYRHVKQFNKNVQESKTETKNIVYAWIYNEYMKIGITQEFIASLQRSPLETLGKKYKSEINNLEKKFPGQLDRIKFYDDKNSGFIIMYFDLYPSKTEFEGTNSLIFADPGNLVIQKKNLAVVEFPTAVPSDYSNLTTLEYGKLNAVKAYLSSI